MSGLVFNKSIGTGRDDNTFPPSRDRPCGGLTVPVGGTGREENTLPPSRDRHCGVQVETKIPSPRGTGRDDNTFPPGYRSRRQYLPPFPWPPLWENKLLAWRDCIDKYWHFHKTRVVWHHELSFIFDKFMNKLKYRLSMTLNGQYRYYLLLTTWVKNIYW